MTTKFNRKKIIAAAVAVLVILCIVLSIAVKPGEPDYSPDVTVRSNEQRITYLSSLGWDVEPEPLEKQTIIIPKKLDGVFAEYNDLQTKQGFDLSGCAGMEATRYSYRVTNFPGDEDVIADIIVCNDRIVAGDLQSTALDGFIKGLK